MNIVLKNLAYCIQARIGTMTIAVADLRGSAKDARLPTPPPPGPNSFNLMQFLRNLAKSYVGAPLEGWCPHLREIMDRPLYSIFLKIPAI